MVESCPTTKRSGIWMPFEYQTKFSLVFRSTFEYRTSEYHTSESSIFRCFRYSDVSIILKLFDWPDCRCNFGFFGILFSPRSCRIIWSFDVKFFSFRIWIICRQIFLDVYIDRMLCRLIWRPIFFWGGVGNCSATANNFLLFFDNVGQICRQTIFGIFVARWRRITRTFDEFLTYGILRSVNSWSCSFTFTEFRAFCRTFFNFARWRFVFGDAFRNESCRMLCRASFVWNRKNCFFGGRIFSFIHSDENFWNSAQLFIFHLKYKYSDDLNNGLVQDTNGTNISDLQMVRNWDHNANNGLVICVLDGVSFMEILATIPSPFLVPPARATSTQFTGALSRKIGPGQNQIYAIQYYIF